MKRLLLFCFLFITVTLPVYAQQDRPLDSTSTLSDSTRPNLLEEVVVRSKKPFVQLFPDKIVVNVDAAITNSGATLLEVLEKSPGITIDRNGSISLKGRQGVLVMIDGKPVNIAGTDLNNLLAGMSAAQIDQVEIMNNPSSKYDAAGNAGVINIKTKKNRQKGFNGNVSSSYIQGRYAKTQNSAGFNYNSGKLNMFLNITANYNKNFSNLYAYRRYYDETNLNIIASLEQPSFFRGEAPSQTIKTGLDYQLTGKTNLGITISETGFNRKSRGNNTAFWMNKNGSTDSTISTEINNRDKLNNVMLNLNGRHVFDTKSELTADLDFLGYRVRNNQHFSNSLQTNNGYTEEITGNLPANLQIFTAKADYTRQMNDGFKMEAGWKSAHVKTNNRAIYFYRIDQTTVPDYNKTNHFLYRENIHAVYASGEKKGKNWLLQAGLRYENTSYNAHQLGNELRKDSSFSRKYDGLFPNFTANVELDSNHSITFTAGRRIDRPSFQALNPFVFVINKYTYEAGNPFYRPQYTWNFELSHTFKNIFVTSINYSRTNDYFSQIFYQDSNGIITYTGGNLDKMENFGISLNVQTPVTHWWSVSAFSTMYYKKIEGFVWNNRRTGRIQANFQLNNQFNFGNGWSGELSWIQQLHEQELQEITDPSGQVGIGVAKQVLKNKGTVKVAFRDLFYTMWMKGFTVFEQSTEYFKITRDTRVGAVTFTYRFGSSSKTPSRRSGGGAEDEMKRATGS